MQSMIHFQQVSKRYPGSSFALANISLEILKGEMVFLTGHSGAGKSTLLKLIALIDSPSGGKISISGMDIRQLKKAGLLWLRQRMGFVFQDFQLLYDRSVYDNVALPLHLLGANDVDIKKRVRAALDTVGLLHKERVNPQTLSGGEQQRIGIARAVVHRPHIILADEPTGNLDPELSAEIFKVFEHFNAHGTTLLIASHDLALLKQLKRRTLVLDQGNLVDDITPS